ncbi:MAG: SDR family oxidoreductase [Flavobacteriaceae bacterium]|nr:SDR family oxidoreductase [Flavobacteriaceae bacterium]MCY4267395.1 SDR family oxidoreductase [Flavobacteriaceae bacterium]MCY4298930.1 SDR family oxidoreductase [Flavobacteriaceae bacterium]
MNLFDIRNKVFVITGGTGTLGFSLIQYLIACGAKIALLTRSKDKAQHLISSDSFSKTSIRVYQVDVLKTTELQSTSEKIMEDFKCVDVLINAVGGNVPGATIPDDGSVFDMKESDFDRVMDLNLKGTLLPTLVFGQLMSGQKSGSIINFSSLTVTRVMTRVVGYSAAKAAMENFTRWMSVDMALKYNDAIRVNAIAPGVFIANQNRSLLTNADGSYTPRGQAIIRNTPMKRFGLPHELHGSVHFLACEASKFVTGIVLPIDGGISIYSGI